MIYLLEDDENIRELILYTLRAQGAEAQGFPRPSAFWQAVQEQAPSLVILDIMLPEEDGLQVLEKLRRDPPTQRVPVLMLTAKDSEYDIVRGLDSGADDYLSKPFGMMELLSRIRALQRRAGTPRRTAAIPRGIPLRPAVGLPGAPSLQGGGGNHFPHPQGIRPFMPAARTPRRRAYPRPAS